jgi:putative ABC transport system permease protein
MTLRALWSLAMSALLRNKMRSLLTTLGIVIGVAAVVTMQAMGQGATAYVGTAISGLGSDVLVAVPGATRSFGQMTLGVPLFTDADLDAIRHRARSVKMATAVSSRTLHVVAGSSNRATTVVGAGPEYFEIRDWHTQSGRGISEKDDRISAQVCVIGATVKNALFVGRDPVGSELRARDTSCRIIGVLEPKGAATFGVDQDDIVFMPYSTFSRRMIGTDRVAMILAAAVSSDRVDDAKDEITRILRRRRHIMQGDDDDFGVRDPREIQSLLQSVTGMLTVLLAGIAGISLLVGGIGIMNIMLVSVTERTREIGVRRAVGARAGDILTQFLIEAVALSAVGGIIGVALGIGAAVAIAHGLTIPLVVPVRAPALAFVVSVIVGVVFGVVPARKAAHLDPLAALRFE